jgi:hypothetical protein
MGDVSLRQQQCGKVHFVTGPIAALCGTHVSDAAVAAFFLQVISHTFSII